MKQYIKPALFIVAALIIGILGIVLSSPSQTTTTDTPPSVSTPSETPSNDPFGEMK